MGVRQQSSSGGSRQPSGTTAPPLAQQPPALRPGAFTTQGRSNETEGAGRLRSGSSGRPHGQKRHAPNNAGKQNERPGRGRSQGTTEQTASSQESVQQNSSNENDITEAAIAQRPAGGQGSSRPAPSTEATPGTSTQNRARTVAKDTNTKTRSRSPKKSKNSHTDSPSQSAAQQAGSSQSSSQNTRHANQPSSPTAVQSAAQRPSSPAPRTSQSTNQRPRSPTPRPSQSTTQRPRSPTPRNAQSGAQRPTTPAARTTQSAAQHTTSPTTQRRTAGAARTGAGRTTAALVGATSTPEASSSSSRSTTLPQASTSSRPAAPSVPQTDGSSRAVPGSLNTRAGASEASVHTSAATPGPSTSTGTNSLPAGASAQPAHQEASTSQARASALPNPEASTLPVQFSNNSGHNKKARYLAAHHRHNTQQAAGHGCNRIHMRILGFPRATQGNSSHQHRYHPRGPRPPHAHGQAMPVMSQPRPSGLAAGQSSSMESVPGARTAADPSNLNVDILDGPQQQQQLQQQETHAQLHTSDLSPGVTQGRPEVNEALPDLLNSHALPPYTPQARQNQHRAPRQPRPHRSRRRPAPRGTTQLEPYAYDSICCCECNRECYLRCMTRATSFRLVLVSLALVGVCCVVTGIVLGVLHMTIGFSFLTLSLMFTGLGVMLVVIIGLAWKCTPRGHEPCHLLFGLGAYAPAECEVMPGTVGSNTRRRDRNWHGGMVYQEFQYRRPPPSYVASMQEFHQNLARAQIQMSHEPPPPILEPSGDDYSLPSSPPPTYKSRASTIRPGLHITFPPTEAGESPSSRPPTYRSHAGTGPRPSIQMDSTDPETSDQQTDSAGSTMHRVNRVVQYLEGVLDSQNAQGGTTGASSTAASSSTTQSQRNAARAADGSSEDRVAADTAL